MALAALTRADQAAETDHSAKAPSNPFNRTFSCFCHYSSSCPRAPRTLDIGFGLLAQSNLCVFDRADDASGEVDGSAFIDLQGADVDTGPQPEFRRSRIGAERTRIVKRRGHRTICGHHAVADGRIW
jgi:hypothetical protein